MMNFKRPITRVTMISIFLIIGINTYADYVIDTYESNKITDRLFKENYTLTKDKDIIVDSHIDLFSDYDFILKTRGNIIFKKNAKIINRGNGSIFLKAGMEPGKNKINNGKIIFDGDEPQIELYGSGKAKIYYNPQPMQSAEKVSHKYQNPNYNYYRDRIKASNSASFIPYMLVNNVQDLRDIVFLLHGNYALSQDIDAAVTKDWDNKKGFRPIRYEPKGKSFYGDFDGNGYAIKNLYINRPKEDMVGLFGSCVGRENKYSIIENLQLENFQIRGREYVGAIAGSITYCNIKNLSINNCTIEGEELIGGVTGSAYITKFSLIDFGTMDDLKKAEIKGLLAGSAAKINLQLRDKDKSLFCDDYRRLIGYGQGIDEYEVNIIPSTCITKNSEIDLQQKFNNTFRSFHKNEINAIEKEMEIIDGQRKFIDIDDNDQFYW